MFIITAIFFTLTVGLFFGAIFTTEMKGTKRTVLAIIIAICVGSGISAMFCLEHKSDENLWNGGYCQCGTEWTFSNAEHTRNSGDLYYWHCENCDTIIKLHSQFKK